MLLGLLLLLSGPLLALMLLGMLLLLLVIILLLVMLLGLLLLLLLPLLIPEPLPPLLMLLMLLQASPIPAVSPSPTSTPCSAPSPAPHTAVTEKGTKTSLIPRPSLTGGSCSQALLVLTTNIFQGHRKAVAKQENGVNSSSDYETAKACSLVTEGHVRAALAADKGAAAHLTAWKVVAFTKKGDNYACVVSSVDVTYELDGQSLEVTYVVKLNPCRNFESSQECDCLLFENESKFYFDIVTEMNSILSDIGLSLLQVPKCIYASLDKYKEVIFLEDLRSQGFKMTDKRRGLDEAHIILVLNELAKLHAASFLLQAKTPGGDLAVRYPFLQQSWPYLLKNNSSVLTVFRGQVKYCKELLTKVGGYERVIQWIDGIRPSLADVVDEQMRTGRFKVVCHGDFWSNNMMFRYSENGHPTEVMLLDHQLSSHSSPAVDLNYLMYTSTTGEVRQPNLKAFLSTYYDTFSRVLKEGNLEPPFTQAQLLQEFREKNVAGALFAMFILPLVTVEPENALDLNSGTDDNIEEMLEDTKAKSMESQINDPMTRQRFLSVFDDMMEAGLFP